MCYVVNKRRSAVNGEPFMLCFVNLDVAIPTKSSKSIEPRSVDVPAKHCGAVL